MDVHAFVRAEENGVGNRRRNLLNVLPAGNSQSAPQLQCFKKVLILRLRESQILQL
jgi:hypothetical protein